MDKDNEAGAKAFVRYFWEVVEYAQKTGDVSTLETLAFDTCEACVGGVKTIRRYHRHDPEVRGGDVVVSALSVKELRAKKQRLFQVDYDFSLSKQTVIEPDGSREVFKGTDARYRFVVSRDIKGAWMVSSWWPL